MGAIEHPTRGLFGYWLDLGAVRGRERVLDLEEEGRDRVVASVARRRVRGFGFDLGAQWILPGRFEPRIFVGLAHGSGDADPGDDRDRAYRQSRLQSNEAGFGGVERFPAYGILLDPELSNLWVWTAGIGFSVLRSSSLDLVLHGTRLDEPAEELRDAFLEGELDGRSRDLGLAFDAVLAIEEWERLELELRFSLFRAGDAYGPAAGRFSGAGSVSVRYAF